MTTIKETGQGGVFGFFYAGKTLHEIRRDSVSFFITDVAWQDRTVISYHYFDKNLNGSKEDRSLVSSVEEKVHDDFSF